MDGMDGMEFMMISGLQAMDQTCSSWLPVVLAWIICAVEYNYCMDQINMYLPSLVETQPIRYL